MKNKIIQTSLLISTLALTGLTPVSAVHADTTQDVSDQMQSAGESAAQDLWNQTKSAADNVAHDPAISQTKQQSQSLWDKLLDWLGFGKTSIQQPASKQTTQRYDAHATKMPSQELSNSVMTDNIKQQLGNVTGYDNGSYIINHNQTDLNANVSTKHYVDLKTDQLHRPTTANAMLDKSAREYRNRHETGNGRTNWKPQGFQQNSKLKNSYKGWLYDRGHSVAYALAGNIKGFDPSESNPKNITTQTAWANEAMGGQAGKGQNYYESIVRKALDQNKRVRYRVTPRYENKNLVPSGSQIEAKSADGSIQFNVFVPNVQKNVAINYANGQASVLHR